MDIEQLEALALGADRGAALAALLPGTPEHDYWRGVLLQQAGRLAEAEAIVAGWEERHGRGYSRERDRLRRRQLVLRATHDLAATANDLQRELRIVLDDRAEVVHEAERFPTRLDPAAIDGARLVQQEVDRRPDLATVTDVALPEATPWIAAGDAARRRALLQRLARANVPGIVELVAADLEDRTSGGFGSLPIHGVLTLEQLAALAALLPGLRSHGTWVAAVLARLRPPGWIDLRADERERGAYLERLAAFVLDLPPTFNTLKAEVLYRRLDLERRRGVYDRARFLAYLDLPRRAPWTQGARVDRVPSEHLVQAHALAGSGLGLEPIGDDEPLVRDFVRRVLAPGEDRELAARLGAGWLDREVAELRLVSGAAGAEAERCARILGPAALAALKDRVEIDLAPENASVVGEGEEVALEVDVKNVRELEVKVFRIQTLAYFLERRTEVDTAIDLDGMVASEELVVRIDAPPLHRSRRRIALEACRRPGTYVVELIGNGRSSRALIRKGWLRHAVRIGAAGAVVTVLDERGRRLPDAQIWLEGRLIEGGVVPFSTHPRRASMLLVHGDVSQVAELDHRAESVALSAGFHVERESLVAGQPARVLCRATLRIGGAPASLGLLEDPRVEIHTTDLAGTPTSRTQPLSLHDDRDAAIDLVVPEGVTRLSLRLRGRVRVVSTQQWVDVEDGTVADVNGIHATEQVSGLHLATTEGGVTTLFVLGKTGEPLVRRAVSLGLQHRKVSLVVTATLETDERGAVELGRLDEIDVLTASVAGGSARSWTLAPRADLPAVVHALEGQEVFLPRPPRARREDLALVEMRGGAPAHDRGDRAALEDGCVVISGLGAGEYRLAFAGVRASTYLLVAPKAAGATEPDLAVAGGAVLQLSPPLPVVRSVEVRPDAIAVRLSAVGPATRVHAIGTRFLPDDAVPSSLHVSPPPPSRTDARRGVSLYLSGRDIGDEYRYVLERRAAPRRPGTMLDKPGLLLNPWALRATETAVQAPAAGAAYAARSAAPMAAPAAPPPAQGYRPRAEGEAPGFTSVDFLARGAAVQGGLRPGADGVVLVDRAALGDAQHLQILVVDPALTTRTAVPLPARAAPARDLRLRLALDPAGHHVEDRSISAAPAGEAIVVPDARTGKVELVDSLARAHQLLLSAGADATLRELGFVTEWASLDVATRRARYSKYACHELHLFLWRKDAAFFEAVVRPYLAHRRDKTFVDRFLLGEDLSPYLAPWAFGRLNVVERILLGQRIPAARAKVARLIGESVDVRPYDPERDARLLATLLGASALEGGGVGSAATKETASLLFDAADEPESEPERPKLAKRKGSPRPADEEENTPTRSGGYGGDLDGFARDRAARERGEPLYRQADRTEEWAETSWYRRRVEDSGPEMIEANRFWRDLAGHDPAQPFLSPWVGECAGSLAEAMCALAFLDLPFTPAAHDVSVADTTLTVTPRSHALAARTRIIDAVPGPERSPVLIGQSYLRADDRWEDDGEREKYVTGEMIAGVVYACQVVVTNPTGAPQKLAVLLQIPRGAVPVGGGLFTRTAQIHVPAYGTELLSHAFYFPLPGSFGHFPAHVSKDLALQAHAEPRTLEVAREPTVTDLGSWAHVSQRGTTDEVLAFLERANLRRIDLGRIAWRMHDRDAFERVTAHLAARGLYDDRLWRYAILHRDAARFADWLRHQADLLLDLGRIEGPVAIDPAERGVYQHLEYAPLVNARAHQLGARRRILNSALEEHYRRFLDLVAHGSRPSADDLLAATHYLLCMDRPDDATAVLARVDPGRVTTRLQHDYLVAWCACSRGDLDAARRLATPWIDHPVDRWSRRFRALVQMLDEVAGGVLATAAVDADDRSQAVAASASREPALDLAVKGGEIVVQQQNVATCQLRFYAMDVELVFSRQPFDEASVDRFSFIEPGLVVDVVTTGPRTTVPFPAAVQGKNVVIEAAAPGARRAIAHYAHDLGLHVSAGYGQIRVVRASTGAALPATYVKVYGRKTGGSVAFYKDGYTDLRGRFDYATLSTDDLDRVERFALLVVSDEAGATIVEAAPPPR